VRDQRQHIPPSALGQYAGLLRVLRAFRALQMSPRDPASPRLGYSEGPARSRGQLTNPRPAAPTSLDNIAIGKGGYWAQSGRDVGETPTRALHCLEEEEAEREKSITDRQRRNPV
jgi:hypothetical protein